MTAGGGPWEAGDALHVVYVTNKVPWPADSGGARREYELLRRLAVRHRIHLVAVGPPRRATPAGATERATLSPLLAGVHVVEVAGGASGSPRRLAEHHDPRAGEVVLEILARLRPDLVHVEGCFLAYALDSAYALDAGPGAATVLVEENVESTLLADEAEAARMREVEQAAWRRADTVVAVTGTDAARVQRVRGGVVPVVPNSGSHVSPPAVRIRRAEAPVGAYVANFGWGPSARAAEILVDRLWPEIVRQVPSATLHLVGAELPPDVGAGQDSVVRVGTVPDVGRVLAEVDVFLCPTAEASGSKIKLHEAIHAGCPVVTFAGGVHGMAPAVVDAVVVAEDAEQFVRASVALLVQDAAASRLRAQASAVAAGLPTWDDAAALLDTVWTTTAGAAEAV